MIRTSCSNTRKSKKYETVDIDLDDQSNGICEMLALWVLEYSVAKHEMVVKIFGWLVYKL